MSDVRFRIVDLYTGSAVIEAEYGEKIVDHWINNYRVGIDSWEIEYALVKPVLVWYPLDPEVRIDWWAKYRAKHHSGKKPSHACADAHRSWAKRFRPHLLTPWLK